MDNGIEIVPTVRDVAMANYMAPRSQEEENLIEMCGVYIKQYGGEELSKQFLSNPTVAMHYNCNERTQILMVNKLLSELLFKHRAINDQLYINRVLLNIDNNLPKQSWFNVITSGVLSFFITSKLSFA